MDVRNIFAGSHTEHQWRCSNVSSNASSATLQVLLNPLYMGASLQGVIIDLKTLAKFDDCNINNMA
jgi:hypothetical protein